MIYFQFKDLKISRLGFGNMRLPTLEDGTIDKIKADEMIDLAYKSGVNYFDTAWGYHNGQSEPFIGQSLKRYPRESWYLATKFPGYEKRENWVPAEVFEAQLEKCGVDYFDFYLFHNVYESNIKTYLNPQWGIVEYLVAQRKASRIKHLGFSTHASNPTFNEFLKAVGKEIEFCQIELNALDWTLQDAKTKYETLVNMNIPVWIMEPIRGGRLASLAEEATTKLKAARADESIAAWAFRWLQSLDGLGVILSGMTTIDHVRDNLKTFESHKPLNDEEKKLYEDLIASLVDLIPCTACRYCMPECPQGLDIPLLLMLYNDCRFEPSMIAAMTVNALKPSKRPKACVGCGSCHDVCPQGIDVPGAMEHFDAILDKLPAFVPPATEDD
ncbi:MAG: aldo/keto reductase [Deltaproteobacteria bacterium]|jgi:predicted aldo/keto reductase-like oxidoreductase|nr:aldo/keto reductase [Deltaproteobacteria bacterium]